MKYCPSRSLFISGSLILQMLIFLNGALVLAQEVEDEREFDYKEGGKKGPGRWGEIKEEWSACKYGKMQSPIDMSNRRVQIIRKTNQVQTDYRACNATARNRGHDITVEWEGDCAGSVKFNGSDYFLRQAHWHSPSEHSVNGRRYSMEVHLVHVCPDPNVQHSIAVIGILYKIGRSDKFLSKLRKDISEMRNSIEDRKLGVSDPKGIKMKGKNYYRYMGSLTVPPCTEGVIWTINQKVMTVSVDQVTMLRDAVHDYAEKNSRPLQPLNDRHVHLHLSQHLP